jgi:hypothetical protein
VFNYSLGRERKMVFERKPEREHEHEHEQDHDGAEVWLTDDSLMVMGPQTNREFVHSVPKERGRRGQRISITFRRIATWISADGTTLLGQGAGPAGRLPVVDSEPDKMALVYKFALDNKIGSSFDWDKVYGTGSGYAFGFGFGAGAGKEAAGGDRGQK